MAEHSSNSDEEWDNLDDLEGATPIMEGVIAPVLRETAISPTTSWDEDDELWPTAGPGRGVGAPRTTLGVSWDENVARPAAEGVVSPRLHGDRQVDETFAWAPDDTWEPGDLSTRGLGRPRSEVERLDELRRAAGDMVPAQGWAANAQGWILQVSKPSHPTFLLQLK